MFSNALGSTERSCCGERYSDYICQAGPYCHRYYTDRQTLEGLFERAQQSECRPLMVMPYTENETPPDPYLMELMKHYAGEYRFATFSEFWHELYKTKEEWPCESADLNPEFTGTFSLRHRLKQQNRKAEDLLIKAEILCALSGEHKFDVALQNAWWEMAFLQFHDILTGSHPDAVYQDCLVRFERVITEAKTVAESVIRRCGMAVQEPTREVYTVYNALPWTRSCALSVELGQGWKGVASVVQDGKPIAFCVQDGKVKFEAAVGGMAGTAIEVNRAESLEEYSGTPITKLENDTLSIELGGGSMIRRILYRPTSSVIVENCDNILTLQRDLGSYQVESPVGAAIPCGAGKYRFTLTREFGCQQAVITGSFPPLDNRVVSYRLTLTLPDRQPYLDIKVEADWNVPGARLRLNLPTTLGATENYYEIPFGVVKRSPYDQTETARGEWAGCASICGNGQRDKKFGDCAGQRWLRRSGAVEWNAQVYTFARTAPHCGRYGAGRYIRRSGAPYVSLPYTSLPGRLGTERNHSLCPGTKFSLRDDSRHTGQPIAGALHRCA